VNHSPLGRARIVPSLVTVVIATRNRAQRLRLALDHLLALPEQPPIIVVDNGSADATCAVTSGLSRRVQAIRLDRNVGAQARNIGVARAGTPYVAFADDDSWWAPGALSRAAARFEAYPRLGILAARTLVGPHNRLDPMSAFMATAVLGCESDLPGPSVLGFLACAAVVRRDAFLAAGGFDPVVFFMGEEARLAYDLAAAGWGLSYCEDVVAHHHPAADNGSAKRVLARRNELLTAWMRRPLRYAMRSSVAELAAASHDTQARRALAGVVRRLPRALARRRPPVARVEAGLCRLAVEYPQWMDGGAAAKPGRGTDQATPVQFLR
jgi:GT2 family glycosyltransferase